MFPRWLGLCLGTREEACVADDLGERRLREASSGALVTHGDNLGLCYKWDRAMSGTEE